jgi:hypothetical protein
MFTEITPIMFMLMVLAVLSGPALIALVHGRELKHRADLATMDAKADRERLLSKEMHDKRTTDALDNMVRSVVPIMSHAVGMAMGPDYARPVARVRAKLAWYRVHGLTPAEALIVKGIEDALAGDDDDDDDGSAGFASYVHGAASPDPTVDGRPCHCN